MPERQLKTWSDYRNEVRGFDSVLEYANAVSKALVGKQIDSARISYAEQIFVKLIAHCIVLRKLSPDPARRAQQEVWDVPSSSAVARCVIEAHDAFEYVVARNSNEPERAFRLLLWEVHDKTRRVKMLDAIGSDTPLLDEMKVQAEQMLRGLQRDPLYPSLRRDLQKKITKGDPQHHTLVSANCAQSAAWTLSTTRPSQCSYRSTFIPFPLPSASSSRFALARSTHSG